MRCQNPVVSDTLTDSLNLVWVTGFSTTLVQINDIIHCRDIRSADRGYLFYPDSVDEDKNSVHKVKLRIWAITVKK